MIDGRTAQLQRMFDEIGLGDAETRRRLVALGGEEAELESLTQEQPQERVFVRLVCDTIGTAENQHG